MKLLIATGNAGKLKEIRRLLEGFSVEVLGLDAVAGAPAVTEDGESFEANALKKAKALADFTGLATLADDSGLEVEALGGAPGIHSARYAGERATDADNNRKLLCALEGLALKDRGAAFRCAMALCLPGEAPRFFSGEIRGIILEQERGEGGFGYDPLFLVPEYGRTMAELPLDVKNRISHRGQALRQLVAYLEGR